MTCAMNLREATTTSGLDVYLSQIKEDRLLTHVEEHHLADAIARGDMEARSKMIRANLRLVIKVARDYMGHGLTLEDLVQEGNLGLMRAVQDFDPSFGVRFSTYASYWIKQAIRNALTNTTAIVRIPAHMVGLLAKWRRTERALAKELGQTPTDDQIAVALGVSEAQRTLLEHARRASQLRLESASSDENGWSADATPDSRGGPDSAIELSDERVFVLKRLDRLDDRERLIVSLRYGLEGQDPLTLKEVGGRLGVTREWVRKIEIRALEKLKADDYQKEPAKPATEKRTKRSRSVKSRNASNPQWNEQVVVVRKVRSKRAANACMVAV